MDVTYRPLRIGWALTGQDIEACRYAALLNYTLWGGRFNPLLPVDRPAFARQLVDAFRVDVETPGARCRLGATRHCGRSGDTDTEDQQDHAPYLC